LRAPQSVLRLTPVVLLLMGSRVRADNLPAIAAPATEHRTGVAASLGYDFNGDEPLIAGVSFGDRAPASTASLNPLLSFHYDVGASTVARPENRVDFARSLLLPGAFAVTAGAAYEWSESAGIRVAYPEVRVGAKVVPWRADTTALRVGFSGGLGVFSRTFDASILLTRAVNALGSGQQRRLLAASNTPDLWASDVSITAGFRVPRPGLGVYGEFDAYLFDSKFHVPHDGRHVFMMGIRKAFGQS